MLPLFHNLFTYESSPWGQHFAEELCNFALLSNSPVVSEGHADQSPNIFALLPTILTQYSGI